MPTLTTAADHTAYRADERGRHKTTDGSQGVALISATAEAYDAPLALKPLFHVLSLKIDVTRRAQLGKSAVIDVLVPNAVVLPLTAEESEFGRPHAHLELSNMFCLDQSGTLPVRAC